MSSASKVKKVIYRLSAIGGGVTILNTVHKSSKKDALKSPKLEFGNQLSMLLHFYFQLLINVRTSKYL